METSGNILSGPPQLCHHTLMLTSPSSQRVILLLPPSLLHSTTPRGPLGGACLFLLLPWLLL